MQALSDLFYPIIARPRHTSDYREIPPDDRLKPYIRCFWGTPPAAAKKPQAPTLVIPDGCMDIVVTINHSTGKLNAIFCGINDAPFWADTADPTDLTSTFGIRFYFWAAAVFTDTGMRGAMNLFADVDQYFGDFRAKMTETLLARPALSDRIAAAEAYLLQRLQHPRPVSPTALNALYSIIKSRGLIAVPDLCTTLTVKPRQLERLFADCTGASPKKIADIVRFQMIWQDMLYGRSHSFSDLAYRYRFADQAHFINSFKKFAGHAPLAALQYARS